MNIVTPSSRVAGSIDIRIGRVLHGWAFNPDTPEEPVTINICVDGEVVVSAADMRESLAQSRFAP